MYRIDIYVHTLVCCSNAPIPFTESPCLSRHSLDICNNSLASRSTSTVISLIKLIAIITSVHNLHCSHNKSPYQYLYHLQSLHQNL